MIDDLAPSQQAALITLRRGNTVATQIVAHFKTLGVRAAPADYRALERMGLAERQRHNPRFHDLTPLGSFKAGQLIVARAREFQIPILTYRSRRRNAFTPGGMSQNGNW